jgi:hypothetical protein
VRAAAATAAALLLAVAAPGAARAAAPVVAPVAVVAAAPGAAQEFPVTGLFAYVDRAWDESGWTGERPELPIRGADVVVLDEATGKVLGRGVTAQDGSFSVLAKSAQPVADLIVRVEARNRQRRRLVGPQTGVTLQSATGETWAASSPVFAAHDCSLALDAGTTVAQPVTIAGDEANPFNVFDCAIAALEYATGPDLAAKPRGAVTLHWPSFTGSWALGRHAWIASDDGDDDAVILHELGHLLHNLYGDSDSPGGMHFLGDSDQDPRLSLAEGYATFFGGCVQNALGRPALYVDCDPAAATGGVQIRLALEDGEPYADSIEGAADEVAVACVLHDLVDGEGAADSTPGADDDAMHGGLLVGGETPSRALWRVFTGPMRRASRLTMDHTWDGWLAVHAEDAHYDELREVFELQRMRFWNDAFEPDGSAALATLVEPGSAWGPEHTLFDAPPGSLEDGTGDRDWFAVELLAGQAVRVETRYPGGAWDARTQADTSITVHAPGGGKVASDDDSGAGRNARVDALPITESGRWLFEVRSRNRTHRYGRYETRVVLLDDP